MSKKIEFKPDGSVNLGKDVWAPGMLGKSITSTTNKIAYQNDGRIVYVTRDVTDENQWRDGEDPHTTNAPNPSAAAKASAEHNGLTGQPSSKNVVHYATGDAPKGKNRFSGEAKTHTCTGKCGERKNAKSFPTITGKDQRVSECRSCRDARRARRQTQEPTH